MPNGIAFQQMHQFSQAAGCHNESDCQEDNKNKQFDEREFGRDCTPGQLPEWRFRFPNRAQPSWLWFQMLEKASFASWQKGELAGRNEFDDGRHGSFSGCAQITLVFDRVTGLHALQTNWSQRVSELPVFSVLGEHEASDASAGSLVIPEFPRTR
jgi:hypothetical protein